MLGIPFFIIHVGINFFYVVLISFTLCMAGVERWWARVQSPPRLLLRRRVVGGVPFHPYLFAEHCWTVWGHRQALLRRRRCPSGDEVRVGRREEVDQDVAAGEEVGRLVRLPRRHPQLIHPST